MKKLLILMLVLGLASASYGRAVVISGVNQDFELVLNGTTLSVVGLQAISGASISVGVYDPDAGTDGYQYNTPAVIVGSPENAGAINYLALWKSGGYDGFDFDAGSTGQENPAHDAQIAVWYTVQYGGNVGDMMDIFDWTVSFDDPIGQMEIVPEPATIALLGLGGLFLLRRRK